MRNGTSTTQGMREGDTQEPQGVLTEPLVSHLSSSPSSENKKTSQVYGMLTEETTGQKANILSKIIQVTQEPLFQKQAQQSPSHTGLTCDKLPSESQASISQAPKFNDVMRMSDLMNEEEKKRKTRK